MWKSEQLLTAIAEASPRDCVTEAAMVKLTGFAARTVEDCCRKLRKHGFMEVSERGCHKLTAAGVAAVETGVKIRTGTRGEKQKPRSKVNSGSVRERTWTALRLPPLKKTIPDLAMLVARGDERNIQSNIGVYVFALERAGFLTRMRVRVQTDTSRSGPGNNRWMVVRNTGPLAPVWRVKSRTVFDPNTGQEWSLTGELLLPAPAGEGAACG